MPADVGGWVEVSRFGGAELAGEHAWQALLNITAYLDGVDEVAEILFGYSKRIMRDEYRVAAMAKDRGLPDNPSDRVKEEIEQIRQFEQEHPKGEFFGYSHIYLNEIKRVDWSAFGIVEKDSEWFSLFGLLDKLLEDHRFQAHKIRLVVWFIW